MELLTDTSGWVNMWFILKYDVEEYLGNNFALTLIVRLFFSLKTTLNMIWKSASGRAYLRGPYLLCQTERSVMKSVWRKQISLFIIVFCFSVMDRKVRPLPSVVSNMSYSKREEDKCSYVTAADRAEVNVNS